MRSEVPQKQNDPRLGTVGRLNFAVTQLAMRRKPPHATPGPGPMHMGMHMAIAMESCALWFDSIEAVIIRMFEMKSNSFALPRSRQEVARCLTCWVPM